MSTKAASIDVADDRAAAATLEVDLGDAIALGDAGLTTAAGA
jgi:hypothetical protein